MPAVPHARPPEHGALAVAHRHGNEVALLHEAAAANIPLVELDLWRFRGRLEVRHLKTAGRAPVLWDHKPWRLVPASAPRLLLADLLPHVPPEVELMLDLKGRDPALPREVVATMADGLPGRAYTVCSQSWVLLPPFRGRDEARVVHSVGNERMLGAVAARVHDQQREGVAIDHRLLTPARVERLRGLADLVMTWTVNDTRRLGTVVDWGVTAVISDDLAVLRSLTATAG